MPTHPLDGDKAADTRTRVSPITLSGRPYYATPRGSILTRAHLYAHRARYVVRLSAATLS